MARGMAKFHTTRGFSVWLKRELRLFYLQLPRPFRQLLILLVMVGLAALLVGVVVIPFANILLPLDEEEAHEKRNDAAGWRTWRSWTLAAQGSARLDTRPDILLDPYLAQTGRLRRLRATYNTPQPVGEEEQEALRYGDRGFYNSVPVAKGGEEGEKIPYAFRQLADFRLSAILHDRVAVTEAGVPPPPPPCDFSLDVLGVCPGPVAAALGASPLSMDDGTTSANPLPGLRTAWRRYTPSQLLTEYGHLDLLYAFVNGTELNHAYRRLLMRDATCFSNMQEQEEQIWRRKATGAPGVPHECAQRVATSFPTAASLLSGLEKRAAQGINERDRETDELRYSLRSVEQHIRWHRGRLLIVSPGHHPTWVDGAKNFLAGACGLGAAEEHRERGAHLRVTTVHQDAIMPYGVRLTMNSHVIEQHLWRAKNITPVHLYFNDDYFVNRDVAITDILNEYGGTIVRTESVAIRETKVADASESWARGVGHNNLFNALELDIRREDYLPSSLTDMWDQTLFTSAADRRPGQVTGVSESGAPPGSLGSIAQALALRAEGNDFVVDIARGFEPEPLVPLSEVPLGADRLLRRRYYASHAPFVYCTNMFRHLSVRYEREFAHNAVYHRIRKARDFFIPFVYNAFVMARPWQASPKFLPYLLQWELAVPADGDNAARGKSRGTAATTTIYLNNEDGCAPATLYSAFVDAHIVYTRLTNEIDKNAASLARIDRENPIFFNINAGFTSRAASEQLSAFLRNRYSTPAYLERGQPSSSPEHAAVGTDLYAALMRLPVIAVSSFAEGLCPMVRSLQWALPDHTGVVLPTVVQHGTGDGAIQTLSQLRAQLRHNIFHGLPVVRCAFNNRVIPIDGTGSALLSPAAAASGEALFHRVKAALTTLSSDHAPAVPLLNGCLPDPTGYGAPNIRAIVLDGRAQRLPVTDALSLRHAVAMPGQTLALEDFDLLGLEDGSSDAVLVLSRSSAAAKAVHWIDGASEADLLASCPIPVARYEDLNAPLRFVEA